MRFLQNTTPVNFNVEKHEYTTLDNKKLVGVNELIHLYREPFDEDGQLLIRCAQKKGISPEELRKQWDQKRDDSCVRGHNLHEEIEYYILNRKIKKDGQFIDAVKQIKKYKFKGKLIPEVVIWSPKYGLAGTVDLLDVYGDYQVDIGDWKQNAEIKQKSFYTRGSGYQMMLWPLSHLMDCNFIHYSLQLSLYELILEEYGYWVNEKKLYHLNPKTNKFDIYSTLSLRKEALNIINHYKASL